MYLILKTAKYQYYIFSRNTTRKQNNIFDNNEWPRKENKCTDDYINIKWAVVYTRTCTITPEKQTSVAPGPPRSTKRSKRTAIWQICAARGWAIRTREINPELNCEFITKSLDLNPASVSSRPLMQENFLFPEKCQFKNLKTFSKPLL